MPNATDFSIDTGPLFPMPNATDFSTDTGPLFPKPNATDFSIHTGLPFPYAHVTDFGIDTYWPAFSRCPCYRLWYRYWPAFLYAQCYRLQYRYWPTFPYAQCLRLQYRYWPTFPMPNAMDFNIATGPRLQTGQISWGSLWGTDRQVSSSPGTLLSSTECPSWSCRDELRSSLQTPCQHTMNEHTETLGLQPVWQKGHDKQNWKLFYFMNSLFADRSRIRRGALGFLSSTVLHKVHCN